jgi:Transglycosylase SLT domain
MRASERLASVARPVVIGGLIVACLAASPAAVEEVGAPPVVASAATEPASPRRWSLRVGGWFISVDGATVDLPSVAPQIAGLPRLTGPDPATPGLSPYDYLIAYHAQAEGLDWRLVAALIYEESRFVADAVSDAGAYGLMQVRPIAAAAVGARRFHAPADNIRTGARYLKQLSETFDDAHGRDHLALVLAAYNMGPGHVHDAQTLARHFGYDPNQWDASMERMLPLLEAPALYEHLPNGYANGTLTVTYVSHILDRYERYRRRFGAMPVDAER